MNKEMLLNEIKKADAIMLKYFKNNRVRNNIADSLDRADQTLDINVDIINAIADMYEDIDAGKQEELFWYRPLFDIIFTEDIELNKIFDRAIRRVNKSILRIASCTII